MGIYRRKRIWWISYYNQYRSRIQESSHSSNRRDAERLHALRKSEVLRGVYRQPVRISLEQFGDRYMEYAKANKRSWLRDEQMLAHLKEFFRAERQLADITPPEIEGYKLQRRKQVSGATVNRELALLKRMFNLAIDWDLYLSSNPLRKVKFFQDVNTGFRVLDLEEGTQAAGECHSRDSGHRYLRPEHGKPDWRDFLPSLAERELVKKSDYGILAKNSKDSAHPDQPGRAPDLGVLGSG